MKQKEIFYDIFNLTQIKRSSIYTILKEGCVSPKKTKIFKPKFEFNNSDLNKIDSIIDNFNKNSVFPSKNDIFNKSKADSNLSFKSCGRTTFYKLLKKWVISIITRNRL